MAETIGRVVVRVRCRGLEIRRPFVDARGWAWVMDRLESGSRWLGRQAFTGLLASPGVGCGVLPIEGAPLPPIPPLPVHKGQGWAVLAIREDFVPGSASAHYYLSALDYQERVQFILT